MTSNESTGDDRKYEVQEPAEIAPPAASQPTPPAPAPSPPPTSERAFYLGVTHDLSLSPGVPRSVSCRCLMVAYGSPNDPRFAWRGEAPPLEPDTLAIAIASDGVACAVPGHAPLRASIAGVEARGSDVVLTVENVRPGLPVMRGAIVPRPAPGAIVVVGTKGSPYGAKSDGTKGPCRIELP